VIRMACDANDASTVSRSWITEDLEPSVSAASIDAEIAAVGQPERTAVADQHSGEKPCHIMETEYDCGIRCGDVKRRVAIYTARHSVLTSEPIIHLARVSG